MLKKQGSYNFQMVSRLAQGCPKVVNFSAALYPGCTKYVPGLKTLEIPGFIQPFLQACYFYMGAVNLHVNPCLVCMHMGGHVF